jgi:general secretion pathway protein M
VEELKQKFHQLSEREQWLVSVSAVVVLIGLFYWLVWAPLNSALESNRQAVNNQQILLSWVQKNANRAVQLRSNAGSAKNFSGSLPQAVNQTAARLNIAISRMQPQGEELQVWVDQAPFNDVLSWLMALQNLGVSILDVDLAEADQPGQVKIRRLQLGKK